MAEVASATVSTNGVINIPALVMERENLGYNDEVRLTIKTPRASVESINIKRFVNSQGAVTVPSDVRASFGITEGEVPEVEWEGTGEHWSPEDGGIGKFDYQNRSDDRRLAGVSDEDDEPTRIEMKSVTDILDAA